MVPACSCKIQVSLKKARDPRLPRLPRYLAIEFFFFTSWKTPISISIWENLATGNNKSSRNLLKHLFGSSWAFFCDVTYGELIPIEIIRSSDKPIRQWRLAETGCWNLHKDHRATLGSIWCDEVMRFGNSWKTLSDKSFNSTQMSQSHEVLQATKFSSSNHGEEKMKIIAIKCWERPHGSKWFLSNLLEIHPAWSFGLSIFKIEIYWNATIHRKQ